MPWRMLTSGISKIWESAKILRSSRSGTFIRVAKLHLWYFQRACNASQHFSLSAVWTICEHLGGRSYGTSNDLKQYLQGKFCKSENCKNPDISKGMQNVSTFLIQRCADLYASIWLRKVTSFLMTVRVLTSGILQICQNPEIIRVPALVSDFLNCTSKCCNWACKPSPLFLVLPLFVECLHQEGWGLLSLCKDFNSEIQTWNIRIHAHRSNQSASLGSNFRV